MAHAAMLQAPSPPLAGERVGVRGAFAVAFAPIESKNKSIRASGAHPLTLALSPASGGEGT